MTEPGPEADTTSHTADRAERRPAPGTPRWAKAFGLVVLALAILFVLVQLVGGGDHGPGRHLPGGGSRAGHEPPAGVEHPVPQP